MSDMITTIGHSTIQHGPENDRVYLMKLHPDDAKDFADYLDRLAVSRGYSKAFAKIPRTSLPRFIASGYELEAAIPYFFPDGAAACFMGKYFTTSRQVERQPQLLHDIIASAKSQEPACRQAPLLEGHTVRMAQEYDAGEMAALYRQVFASYPFPIQEPGFLRAAMYSGTIFLGVWEGKRLVALASAEIDRASRSAEMTDFATLPECRGQGFALHLLQRLEQAAQSKGILSFYTIARAYSYGMNITVARCGYRFGGTLTNNTNIFGSLESMNVWYKTVPATETP